jgi:hypothetical protein
MREETRRLACQVMASERVKQHPPVTTLRNGTAEHVRDTSGKLPSRANHACNKSYRTGLCEAVHQASYINHVNP